MGLINKQRIDKILTVKHYSLFNQTEESIDKILASSCDGIRFNLAKINELILLDDIFDNHEELYCKKIIFDFPIPQAKFRISFNSKDIMEIEKGKIYTLDLSGQEDWTDFSCSVREFQTSLDPAQPLICGDGEGFFTITKVSDNICWLMANNDFELINGKALHTKSLIPSYLYESTVSVYKQFLHKHKPDIAMFSFVDDADQIDHIKRVMHPEPALFASKIETERSVQNIKEIADHSDLVLIGRGDLGIYSDLFELYSTQNEIVRNVKSRNKYVYIATDILESLCRHKSMPCRADIIDVTHMIASRIDGIILSAGISDFAYAIEIIEQIEEKWIRKVSESKGL